MSCIYHLDPLGVGYNNAGCSVVKQISQRLNCRKGVIEPSARGSEDDKSVISAGEAFLDSKHEICIVLLNGKNKLLTCIRLRSGDSC